jgi:hypothetical protein
MENGVVHGGNTTGCLFVKHFVSGKHVSVTFDASKTKTIEDLLRVIGEQLGFEVKMLHNNTGPVNDIMGALDTQCIYLCF